MKNMRHLITVIAVMITAALGAQTTNPDTVCVNASGVEYFVHKTTGSTYSWSLSGGGTIATVQDTLITVDWGPTVGTDSVYVVETNSFGCVGDTVALGVTREPMPIADAGNDTIIGHCSTSSVQIGPSTVDPTMTYTWSPAAGLSNSNVPNPVANPASTTTYVLTVSSPYGCSTTDTITVTVDSAPIADAGADQVICNGQSVQIDGSMSSGTNLTYAWNGSNGFTSTAVSPTVNPNDTTVYTLVVTDEYGCTDTSTVTVSVVPDVVADAGVNDTICEGETHMLSGSATNQTSVVWSTSGDGSFVNGTSMTPEYIPGPMDIANGTVTLTITANGISPCGQDTDDIILIIHPKPVTSPIFNY